eukprot:sb/3465032/
MLIKEFQITLPLTVEEYQVGQLYVVAEASKAETGGGDGVEVLKNEPFTDHPEFGSGQYTYKIYHLQHKVPGWIQALAPTGSLELHEEAWNAFPYCKTVLTNPDYMKDGFNLVISSWHKPDKGEIENVHNLPPEKLNKREVCKIDIANDHVRSSDYKKEFDPKQYNYPRGPLNTPDWQNRSREKTKGTRVISALTLVGVDAHIAVSWLYGKNRLRKRVEKKPMALEGAWLEKMLIKEFQITLPLTVEEYQVGQLYVVAEASKAETGGGDGVEVLKNEPFTDHPEFGSGQYTYKIYHLQHKVPGWIQALAPTGSLELHEEAWNAFPYCKTVLTNPDYMKDGFNLVISSWHKPDKGEIENVHNLPPEKLNKREVCKIDIANDHVRSSDADHSSALGFFSTRFLRRFLPYNHKTAMCASNYPII